jgi:hypothetical protein
MRVVGNTNTGPVQTESVPVNLTPSSKRTQIPQHSNWTSLWGLLSHPCRYRHQEA